LEERRELPYRTMFMNIQNAIWNLLKLESFPRFRAELEERINTKLPKKDFRNLQKKR